jgi:hypothetical protein
MYIPSEQLWLPDIALVCRVVFFVNISNSWIFLCKYNNADGKYQVTLKSKIGF